MSEYKFPEYNHAKNPFPQKGDDFINQWDSAYRLLTGAEEAGVLDMPVKVLSPSTPFGDPMGCIDPIPGVEGLNPMRVKVMASKLWLMGYLKKKPRKREGSILQTSQPFIEAVRAFQTDAGLIVDGWIGNQTWNALRTLVSFETETRIDKWVTGGGEFMPAFNRAVQLRLWAYGLVVKGPKPSFEGVSSVGIKRLQAVLWSLGVVSSVDTEPDHHILFAHLFDPDGLVAAAANFKPLKAAGSKGNSFRDTALSRQQTEIKRRFLVNLAKVELWLLGSEITIDGMDDYPVEGLGVKKRKKVPSEHVTEDATDPYVRWRLIDFWIKLGGFDKKEASKRAKSIAPSLFKSLIEPGVETNAEVFPMDDADYSEAIARQFEAVEDKKELTKKIMNAHKESRGLGMILWDGLKRLWRWVKKGVKAIVDFTVNVSRTFFRFALKGFTIVRTAFSVFASSMEQYFKHRIDLKENQEVVVLVSKDMDKTVVISDTATQKHIVDAQKKIDRFGAMFYFSCRLVQVFTKLIIGIATGLSGWVRLIMTLVKGYRKLIPAYRELAKVL